MQQRPSGSTDTVLATVPPPRARRRTSRGGDQAAPPSTVRERNGAPSRVHTAYAVPGRRGSAVSDGLSLNPPASSSAGADQREPPSSDDEIATRDHSAPSLPTRTRSAASQIRPSGPIDTHGSDAGRRGPKHPVTPGTSATAQDPPPSRDTRIPIPAAARPT